MYRGYMDCKYGILEIIANDSYLTEVKIIKKIELEEAENKIVKEAKKQLESYFDEEQIEFDLPIFFDDILKSKILKEIIKIPIGEILTCKEIAEKVNTKSILYVSKVVCDNPLQFIIPTHRVKRNKIKNKQSEKIENEMLLKEYRYIYHKKNFESTDFTKEEILFLKKHTILKKMFTNMPMCTSIEKFKSVFTCLVVQIIYQQVSFKTAYKQETLLAKLCDYDMTREKVTNLSDEKLIEIGLNGPRLRYIRNVCNYDYNYDNLYNLSDEEVYDELIKIKGIGSWTIEMVLLFALGRKDIISYKDLIILNGIKHLYKQENLTKEGFFEIVKTLKGFETIASMNLWKYMEKGYYLK